MLRRTLLLGLAGGLGGRHLGADRPSASAIMASTRTSTLAARAVTPLTPEVSAPPAAVASAGRLDLTFARAGRTLPTRVWYPAGTGTHPVILFSHGLSSQPDDYTDLLAGWALAGFVVAAPLYPHTSLGTATFNAYDVVNQPLDASAVLTQLLESPLRGRLDPARLVAAGHSAGGITTTGLFSEHRDNRLRAGVVIAGTDFLGTPFRGRPAGLLFVHGRRDRTVSWPAAHTVFQAVPWSRAMLTITGGGHEPVETAVTTPASVAFLRWALHGRPTGLTVDPAVATMDDQRNAARTPASSSGATG